MLYIHARNVRETNSSSFIHIYTIFHAADFLNFCKTTKRTRFVSAEFARANRSLRLQRAGLSRKHCRCCRWRATVVSLRYRAIARPRWVVIDSENARRSVTIDNDMQMLSTVAPPTRVAVKANEINIYIYIYYNYAVAATTETRGLDCVAVSVAFNVFLEFWRIRFSFGQKKKKEENPQCSIILLHSYGLVKIKNEKRVTNLYLFLARPLDWFRINV